MGKKYKKKKQNTKNTSVARIENEEYEDRDDYGYVGGFYDEELEGSINDGSHFDALDDDNYEDYPFSHFNTDFGNLKFDNELSRKYPYYEKYVRLATKSRPILNYDFYNAYRNTLTDDKKFSTFSALSTRIENLKKEHFEYMVQQPSSGRLSRRLQQEENKLKKSSIKLTVELAFIFTVIGLLLFILLFAFLDALLDLKKNSGIWKFLAVGVLEAGIIYAVYKCFTGKKTKKKLKELADTQPYYKLALDLHFVEARHIQFDFPTKRIDGNYRRYKNNIELEWKASSHDFITDMFFRMKAFDCFFPNYGHMRFFVEIKYESCFPDYPELIGIEKQLEFLPFIPKDEYRPKAKIQHYKTLIRENVLQLINTRIPKMKVRDIVVAVGILEHNTKKPEQYDEWGNFQNTPKEKPKKEVKTKWPTDKPMYMETESERESKTVYKNDYYLHIEKYRKPD